MLDLNKLHETERSLDQRLDEQLSELLEIKRSLQKLANQLEAFDLKSGQLCVDIALATEGLSEHTDLQRREVLEYWAEGGF